MPAPTAFRLMFQAPFKMAATATVGLAMVATTLAPGAVSANASATPVGTWKTIDDETGKAKSHVQIVEVHGKLYGKVSRLLIKPSDTICTKCTGERAGKKILGMMILWGLKYDEGSKKWKGGKIFDPEKDKAYRAAMWNIDNDQLKVRGYLGPFYRTQMWYRVQ
ncbi:MAG: DUF2147 domain-containing protein [Nannocystaceae bacterium]